jgi:hypothetical protein
MRVRGLLTSISTLALTLALAAAAVAGKGGEGLYGKTDDKVITNFGFGLIIFFTTIVITFSVIQHLLDRRKTRR